MDLSGYTFTMLRQDTEFMLCRGRAVVTATLYPASVLLSIPASEHSIPDRIRMLEHELSLRQDLEPAWAVRPLALVQYQGRPALVLEDPQGEPLERFLSKPPSSRAANDGRFTESAMELGLFLRLAIGAAVVLGAAALLVLLVRLAFP